MTITILGCCGRSQQHHNRRRQSQGGSGGKEEQRRSTFTVRRSSRRNTLTMTFGLCLTSATVFGGGVCIMMTMKMMVQMMTKVDAFSPTSMSSSNRMSMSSLLVQNKQPTIIDNNNNNAAAAAAAVQSVQSSTSSRSTSPLFMTKKPTTDNQSPTLVGPSSSSYEYALLFDCDGVILETEELHRLAYNEAFKAAGLLLQEQDDDDDDDDDDKNNDNQEQEPNTVPVVWTVEYYDVLQNTVGGGKPKMFFHFTNTTNGKWPSFLKEVEGQQQQRCPPPTTPEEKQALVDKLQTHKTEIYRTYIEDRAVSRPGVLELMDEALDDPTIAVGVCSASTKEAALKVLDVTLGPDRISKLDVCILGDDVSAKKPDPMIYNEALSRLSVGNNNNLSPNNCVVIEDSMVGLRAAKAAGMYCIITYTPSTENEDFYNNEGGGGGAAADAKVPDLQSRGQVTVQSIFEPLRSRRRSIVRDESESDDDNVVDFLPGIKDPINTK